MPRSLVLSDFWNSDWISIYMVSGTAWVTAFLFVINTIINLFLLVGYYTKTSAVLSYIFLVSLQDRNILVGHAGDVEHRIVALFACLLPLSDVWSVDAALKMRERGRQNKPAVKRMSDEPQIVMNFVTVAVITQICAIYYMAYFHKSAPHWNQGSEREALTATWLALQLDFFRRWPWGDLFLTFPSLCKFMTLAVHNWQLQGVFFLFWPIYTGPARMFSFLGYFAMHLGFALCLRLAGFVLVAWATLMLILPSWFWDEIVACRWLKTPERTDISVYYNRDCAFCHTLACLTHSFLLYPEARLLPTFGERSELKSSDGEFVRRGRHDVLKTSDGDLWPSDQPEDPQPGGAHRAGFDGFIINVPQSKTVHTGHHAWIVVEDHRGNVHRGWRAVVAVCQGSPLLFPLAPLLARCAAVGDVALSLLHQHKAKPSSDAPSTYGKDFSLMPSQVFKKQGVTVHTVAKTTYRTATFLAAQLFGAFAIYVIITWNCGNLGWYGIYTNHGVHRWVSTFHLEQYWGVFAPHPPDSWWWYNIEATLDNGQKVELFDQGAYRGDAEPKPHTWAKPDPFYVAFKNHRWFKLFENGYNSHPAREKIRLEFGRWVCRTHNSRHSPDQRVWRFTVHIMSERANYDTMDGYGRIPSGSGKLWEHICYNDVPSFQLPKAQPSPPPPPPPVVASPLPVNAEEPQQQLKLSHQAKLPGALRKTPKQRLSDAHEDLKAAQNVEEPQPKEAKVQQQQPADVEI